MQFKPNQLSPGFTLLCAVASLFIAAFFGDEAKKPGSFVGTLFQIGAALYFLFAGLSLFRDLFKRGKAGTPAQPVTPPPAQAPAFAPALPPASAAAQTLLAATLQAAPPAAPPALTVSFLYEKADGTCARRRARLQSISREGGALYLNGLDLDRGQTRTYKAARITGGLADAETGEILPLARAVALLPETASGDADHLGDFLRQRSAARASASAPPCAPERPQILFTGFAAARRQQLEAAARRAGLHVVTKVTRNLHWLCTGPKDSPGKTAQALERGAEILTESQFQSLPEMQR